MDHIDANKFQRLDNKLKIPDVSHERGIWYRIFTSFKSNKLAVICLILLTIIAISAVCAPLLTEYDPNKMDLMNKLAVPSSEHWFGTDDLGRDYFARALYGGRVSLTVGVFSMCVALIIGTLFGTISGYIGGKVDTLMMRFVDIFMSIPSFVIIIIINSFFTPKIGMIILIIGLFSWTGVARIVRAETMSLKERDFVLAAKSMGASNWTIMMEHIIPNMVSQIIVAGSISVARAILTESSLSFLGFGIQKPQASWGSMLQNAQTYILDMPMLAVFPGMLILITVLSFNVLGDVLRSALEPKLVK